MKKVLIISCFISLFAGFFIGYYGMHFFGREIFAKEGRVLSTKTEEVGVEDQPQTETPAPTSTMTPTPTPTNTPVPSPTLTPTPTPIPQPLFSPEQVHGFIERFAAQYGVDANVLRHIAVCESGFDPSAFNRGYAGLYQFGPVTWKNNRVLMGEDVDPGLRFNAEEAAQTAAYLVSIGKGYVWPNCFP